MSTHPMPACEALAADPARHIFKLHLQRLVLSPSYELRLHEGIRMAGYLSALQESALITEAQLEVVNDEIHAFVWGARS